MKNALIIFTRVPVAGQTKTRLMPYLTGEECKRLHECFLKDLFWKVKELYVDIFVFFTPEDKEGMLRSIIGEEIIIFPQYGENLGERMKNAIATVLRKGYEKAVLIGTDIPQIEVEIFAQAFDSLNDSDIVIHPTFDGGYYLIGMKKNYDSIWKIERYGTNTVIQDTLSHMQREHLKVAVGKRYYDIDDRVDLKNLYEDIRKGTIVNCPVTSEYLKVHLKDKLEKENEEL